MLQSEALDDVRGASSYPVDPEAVVDSELSVYGMDNLRVVDASAMPMLVDGNSSVPNIMIAEKIVDVIKAKCSICHPADASKVS